MKWRPRLVELGLCVLLALLVVALARCEDLQLEPEKQKAFDSERETT